MTYTIFNNVDGFREIEAIIDCDSDAQAEYEVRRICEDTDENGYTISRGDTEWFVRA